jgi:cytochrome P450
MSKKRIFFRNLARWYPNGLLTWFFERSESLGQVRLRQNRDEAHKVARALIAAKREELKAGTFRKDLMSLLGSRSSARSRKSGAYVGF